MPYITDAIKTKKVLSLIKSKIVAAGVFLFGILIFIIKYQSSKIDKLDHENKIHEKKDEIQQQQIEDKKEVIEDEKERINERIKEGKTKSRRDRFNKL